MKFLPVLMMMKNAHWRANEVMLFWPDTVLLKVLMLEENDDVLMILLLEEK